MPYVYFQREAGRNLYKIGKENELGRRAPANQTGNPRPLTVFDRIETQDEGAAFACEKHLHKIWQSRWRRGDWFELSNNEAKRAVEEGNRFVEQLWRLRQQVADLPTVVAFPMKIASENEATLIQELLEVREQQERLAAKREEIECRLKLIISGSEGIEGYVTWRNIERIDLDKEALRAYDPSLFERFARKTTYRQFRLLGVPEQPESKASIE